MVAGTSSMRTSVASIATADGERHPGLLDDEQLAGDEARRTR